MPSEHFTSNKKDDIRTVLKIFEENNLPYINRDFIDYEENENSEEIDYVSQMFLPENIENHQEFIENVIEELQQSRNLSSPFENDNRNFEELLQAYIEMLESFFENYLNGFLILDYEGYLDPYISGFE